MRPLEIEIALIQRLWILRQKILGLRKSNYRLLVPNTNDKLRIRILASSKLDLLITLFFYTDDITTVAYRDDLGDRIAVVICVHVV